MFMTELKNLDGLNLSDVGRALKETFDLLNVNRLHTGVDNYGLVSLCLKTWCKPLFNFNNSNLINLHLHFNPSTAVLIKRNCFILPRVIYIYFSLFLQKTSILVSEFYFSYCFFLLFQIKDLLILKLWHIENKFVWGVYSSFSKKLV